MTLPKINSLDLRYFGWFNKTDSFAGSYPTNTNKILIIIPLTNYCELHMP